MPDDHSAGAPASDALIHLAEIAGMAGFGVHGLAEKFDQVNVENRNYGDDAGAHIYLVRVEAGEVVGKLGG